MGGSNQVDQRKNRAGSRGGSLAKWGIASAAIAAAPAIGMAQTATYLYTGANSATANTPYIDGGSWSNGDNWENVSASPTTYGTVPAANPANSTADIDADTGFTPTADPNFELDGQSVLDNLGSAQGAVYNPGNSSPLLSLDQLYVASSNAKTSAGVQPNLLSFESGSMEVTKSSSPVEIGRDDLGVVDQTGGSFITDINIQVGGDGSDVGNGVINYYGGVLQAGISSSGVSSTTSSTGIRLGNYSAAGAGVLGIINVYNDGNTSSQINLNNLYVGYTQGSIGVLNYILQNGGVKTINITGGNSNPESTPTAGTQGQLAIRNYAASPTFGTGANGTGGTIGSVLNLTLAAAPSVTLVGDEYVPQNLALITYVDGIHGEGGDDEDFFSTSGTDLTNGSTISASYDGYTYDWTLEYAGSVSSVSSNIPSDDISGTGGDSASGGTGAVVLVGEGSDVPVPEPATLAVLGLGSLGLLARRRKSPSA